MKTNFQKPLFLLVLFFIISFNGLAASYTWTGLTSSGWSISTNWNPKGFPTADDTITISNQANNPILSVNTTVKKLTINSGVLNLNTYTLTISSLAYFNAGAINNGVLYSQNAAVVTFSGTTSDCAKTIYNFLGSLFILFFLEASLLDKEIT